MAVVIRMQRGGGKNAAFFRVVVADSRRARDGRFIEKLGYYNPLTSPAQVKINQERARYWIDKGARPSEAVSVLLKRIDADTPLVQTSAAGIGSEVMSGESRSL